MPGSLLYLLGYSTPLPQYLAGLLKLIHLKLNSISPHNLFFLMVPQHKKFKLHSSSCSEQKNHSVTSESQNLIIFLSCLIIHLIKDHVSATFKVSRTWAGLTSSIPSTRVQAVLISSLTTEGASLLGFHPCLLSSHSEPFDNSDDTIPLPPTAAHLT